MTLNKVKKRGGGRKRFKRDGALKDQPVGISVWGKSKIEKLEGLIQHREANLRRALQKGYHPAAVGRYQKEIKAAREELEDLINEAEASKEEEKQREERKEQKDMEKALQEMKQRLENRPLV